MLDFPLGRRLKRLFDSNDFAWNPPLPFWAPERDRRLRRLRAAGRRLIRRRDLQARGALRLLASSLAWPAVSGLKAWVAGRAAVRQGQPARFWLRWWLQLAHNFCLSEQENAGLPYAWGSPRALGYITDAEHKALTEHMNRGVAGARIGYKAPFELFCAEHGLPTPRVLAEGGGSRAQATWHAEPPARDLFCKLADGWGGSGGQILTWQAEASTGSTGRWRVPDGSLLSRASLETWLNAHFKGRGWVLQPRLRNAAAWMRFTPGALSTLRIVTGLCGPEAEPEVLCALIRFPRNTASVDNLSSGGIGSEIDVRSGRMGPARGLEFASRPHSSHPTTGARIEGELLPGWAELAALACRAHAAVRDVATIGWDLTLGEDGPMLIEANPNWGVHLDLPLADTRYLEVMEHPSWASRLR